MDIKKLHSGRKKQVIFSGEITKLGSNHPAIKGWQFLTNVSIIRKILHSRRDGIHLTTQPGFAPDAGKERPLLVRAAVSSTNQKGKMPCKR